MKRFPTLLALVAALALTAGACADPAAGITAGDSAPGLACESGALGSSGGKECPPPTAP